MKNITFFQYFLLVIFSIFTIGIQAQNVGISTSEPAARLHVKLNSNVTYPQLLLDEDDNDFSRLTFKNNATSKTWSAAAYPNEVDSLAWFNIYNSSTGNLLTVNGKGKLGIGITPAYPLSLNNDLGDKIALWGGGGYGPHYGFGIQTSLFRMFTANANDDIAFGYGSSTGFTENVRITGDGKVGIGTNNPGFPLSFASTMGDKITMWGNNPNSHFGFGIQPSLLQMIVGEATSDFVFGYGGSGAFTEGVRITGDGNVGIGTSDPAFALSFSQGLGDKISLYGANPASHYGFGIQTSLMQIHSSNSLTDIAFGYGGSAAFTEHMRVRGNGKVGIGTSVPDTKFHVAAGASGMDPNGNSVATFEGAASAYVSVLASIETGVLFGADGTATDGGVIYNNPSLPKGLLFRTNNNVNRMAISSEGNVGIGTTNPTTELEVNGFTKLGSNAPKIKMVKLTSTTSSVQGGSQAITHGIQDINKILSVEVIVGNSGSYLYHHSYTYTSGHEFNYYLNPTTMYVINATGNSEYILSKPIKILITVEE